MQDRYMLRTAMGQEYFSAKEDLLIRVSGLLDSESSIGMYLQRYPAEFGDKPDTHTRAVVSVDEQEAVPAVEPVTERPATDMHSFEYRADRAA